MASWEHFTYAPLDSQPGAFRLLRLLKGVGPWIDVELVHTTLEQEDGSYEAISYAWGSPEIEDDVYIHDKILGITYNLSLILHDLRSADEDRVLWIDATCINQANLDEQGQQVQQMGDIYRHARAVLFCIGRPTELTDFLFDTLSKFLTEVSQDEAEDLFAQQADHGLESPLLSRWQDFVNSYGYEHHMCERRLFLAFQHATSEAWFRRVWVVQEAYNARKGFVYCGARSIPAAVFAVCGDFILLSFDGATEPTARALLGLMSRTREARARDVVQRQGLRELITQFSESEATIDYDKIYGLLSMATLPCAQAMLQPSYTIDPDMVILKTIRHICNSKEEFSTQSPYIQIKDFIEDMKDIKTSVLLLWAARGGYDAVARYMIENGANPSHLRGQRGGFRFSDSPLGEAAAHGRESIVDMLLATGRVDPDRADTFKMPPLFWAAARGHVNVFTRLLATGKVRAARSDITLRSPLCMVAENGNEAILRILLPISEDYIDKPDKHGSTPLCYAAKNGHQTAVDLLLSTGQVRINFTDKANRTAFFLAAGNGHCTILRTLLQTGQVSIDARDEEGKTPLSEAAARGHYDVVQLLLATGQVDIDSRDDRDETPLFKAAFRGHDGVVQLLLATGQVKVDLIGEERRSPLYEAACGGHVAVVKMLLETGQVDVNAREAGFTDHKTPLGEAAAGEHVDVVSLLLAQEDIDINLGIEHGENPLLSAAGAGNPLVVKLLLATPGIEVDTPHGYDDETPISKAIKHSYADIVELLLATHKVNLQQRGRFSGYTLLHRAINAKPSNEDVVKQLLDTGQLDVNARDHDGATPFFQAVQHGSHSIAEILLATGRVDVNIALREEGEVSEIPEADGKESWIFGVRSWDYAGCTPLSMAVQCRDLDMVKLLLATDKVDLNKHGNDYWPPLCEATQNDEPGIVELLLATGKVDVNLRDKGTGATPLHHAAEYDNVDAARLLLATNQVDLDVEANDGKTPKVVAQEWCHLEMVDLIRSRKAQTGWDILPFLHVDCCS